MLVVDVANVVGSQPNGWWRDRAGATTRALAGLAALSGSQRSLPDGSPVVVDRVIAVVEGQGRRAHVPATGVDVVLAPTDGDAAVVFTVEELQDARVLVVTADRGLRARLPAAVAVVGPSWLRDG